MPGWTPGPGIPVSMAVPRPRGPCVRPQRPEPTGWGEGQSHHWFLCALAILGPEARTWPPEAPGLELAPSLFWVLSLAWLRTLVSGLTVRCVRPFLLMEKPLWAVRRPHKQ